MIACLEYFIFLYEMISIRTGLLVKVRDRLHIDTKLAER